MKSILGRVHLHSHKEPQGCGHIVGDPAGLLALAKTLEKAARGLVGIESVKLYSSDGHAYEILVVADVSEQEWQDMPLPYDKKSDPSQLVSIKSYAEIKQQVLSDVLASEKY